MIDEELHALRGILEGMDPDTPIKIGPFNCHAHELLSVVFEAVQARIFLCRETSRNRIKD